VKEGKPVKVKSVMTKEVQGAEVPGNREEALELLKKLKVSALPVLKHGTKELVGIVRLRDFFENPDESQLGMLVNRDVITVREDDSIREAAEKMLKSGARRLPVIKDGELAGIITVRDIVCRAIAEMDIKEPASDYMQQPLATVWEGTPLQAAVEMMGLAGVRALPVINVKGELVGVIDDSDIIAVSEVETESKMGQMKGRSEGDSWTWDSEDRIYITKKKLKAPDKPVQEVMSKNLVTVTKRTSVSKCAKLMKKKKIEQTPVVTAGGDFVGVVRDEDLLQALKS